MKLKKQPETELEYFRAIESLGAFIWTMEHDLADGRIEDSEGGIDNDIQKFRRISKKLVSELKEKFGVIPPEEYPNTEIGKTPPPAPEGKTYYWDWYKKMNKESFLAMFNKLICSVCPFNENFGKMSEEIEITSRISCTFYKGSFSKLRAPYSCFLVDFQNWTKEKLYQKIILEHGEEALEVFKAKEEKLKLSSVKNRH